MTEFQQEQEVLKKTIEIVTNKIKSILAAKPYPNVSPYDTAYDIEDRESLQYKKQRNAEIEQKATELFPYTENPYFCRMDFSVQKGGEDQREIYVGKSGLNIEGQQLIYDWRSPVGQRYYRKSETRFDYNGYKYTLLLRRALQIEKGNLIDFNDEYISGISEIINNITDPFLVKTLKEKRAKHHLTDIIKTIQENQNDIISYSVQKNFILQGCAGSGKTMILLHRLSHIAFNNPHFDFSKVKILTPNNNFNMHIIELYKELGLDKIEMYTVNDYYYCLLHLYDQNRWGRPKSIASDSSIDNSLVEEIYSKHFLNKIVANYNQYISNSKKELNPEKINVICKQHDMPLYEPAFNERRSLKIFVSFLKVRLEEDAQVKRNLEITRSRLESIEDKINKTDNTDYATTKQNIDIKRKKTIKLEQDISALNDKTAQICHRLNIAVEMSLNNINYEKTIKSIEGLRKELVAACEDYHIAYNAIQLDAATYKKAIDWHEDRESIEHEKVQQLTTKLASISFFRFADRRLIRDQIKQLKKLINEKQTQYIAAAKLIQKTEIKKEELQAAIKEAESHLPNDSDLEFVREAAVKDKQMHKSIINLAAELKNEEILLNIKYKEIEELNIQKDKYVSKIADYEKKALSKEETQWFTEKLTKAEKTTFEIIYDKCVHEELKKLFVRYAVPNCKKTYRYQMYLELLCYTLYAGAINNGDRFLNIDEGQDLAETEYELFRRALGKNLIYNIYGDINQTISRKGVHDWSSFSWVDRYFTLKEDYRNSEQITDFCNETLGYDFTSIGIIGPEVSIVSLEDAKNKLRQHKLEQRSMRVAVIVKNYDQQSVGGWKELGCKDKTLEEGAVSLLSVEDAKGLEFENVIVVDADMTKNEKYISYTRALECLVVAR